MIDKCLQECAGTVISTLARRVEELEDAIRWKDQRIETLEKLNREYRRRLGEPEQEKRPCDMLFKYTDLLREEDELDPFTGGPLK